VKASDASCLQNVQIDFGAHPAYPTKGYLGSFPRVKRPGLEINLPPRLVPVSRISRAIPLFPQHRMYLIYLHKLQEWVPPRQNMEGEKVYISVSKQCLRYSPTAC